MKIEYFRSICVYLRIFLTSGLVFTLPLTSCYSENKQMPSEVHSTSSDALREPVYLTQPLALNSPEIRTEECSPLNVKQVPIWFPDLSVYLTRVSKPCRTTLGDSGSLGKSQWAAMGMPCSGGSVRFRWLDNYLDPKQVLFDFGIACPMKKSSGDVSSVISKLTGLEESKMLAYIPMYIVYWELTNTGEKDTGSSIKLNDMSQLKPFWRGFVLNKKPLKFKFVGYESGWADVRQYYEVKADIFLAERNTFRLAVTDTRLLEVKDKTQIEQECRQLSPSKDCDRLV